jgi:hypothetical protein
MPTYDPSRVSITVGSSIVIGRGESTFVAASRNEDGVTLKMGSDGRGTRNMNTNKSGTISVTLLADSPTNDDLDEIAVKDEDQATGMVTITVNDQNGNAQANLPFGWVKKIPDLERAKEMGEVTWQFEGRKLELNQGAGTPDPDEE